MLLKYPVSSLSILITGVLNSASDRLLISILFSSFLWGTVPSVGNVAQPRLGKASGECGWQAGPTSMDRFSSGKSGLHCT